MDSANVVTSIQEHYKVHLGLDSTVVFGKELFNLCLKLIKISNLLVDSDVNIDTIHKVTEDNPFSVEKHLLFDLEFSFTLLNH